MLNKSSGAVAPKEHEACVDMKLPNGGRLNRVFIQMGIAYARCPKPSTEASITTIRKQKADTYKKVVVKKAKIAPTKKSGVVKIIRQKPKSGLKGTSERELALAKPLGATEMFAL
jgi:hypothetical protein